MARMAGWNPEPLAHAGELIGSDLSSLRLGTLKESGTKLRERRWREPWMSKEHGDA